ncbi:hypothetical protein GGI15_001965 [Coemansia interrupta]|uniref:ABC1 atypical kinase-like domain-containing protein n=1 Tax=Coemansia interrupta TaxID=1126814 RepID=A0A9W8HFK8_9FUNG|nr:hypothetical protein GGI15_001965 [Coemansia interrupta]
MALADAYLVLRATRKVAKLVVREAVAGVEEHMRTSSLFSTGIPQAQDTAPDKEGPSTDISNGTWVGKTMPQPLSNTGLSGPPICLHPGPLDRSYLLQSIKQSKSEIRVATADLSYLRLYVPPPLICLRGEQLQIPTDKPSVDASNDEIGSEKRAELKEASMPSTRVSRLFHYGSLAVGIGFGALGEATRRWSGMGSSSPSSSSEGTSSVFLTRSNMDRIVDKLSRMRGAALKLGQMLSIQDSKSMSPEITEVLQRVQNSANYVPISQIDKSLRKEIGQQWREGFSKFSDTPFAAASIGQVHEAELNPQLQAEHHIAKVAVKVQYPGVADSIDSDLNNMQSLLMMSKLLPRGMYLENTIKVARKELHWECDYKREAEAMVHFGRLLANDPVFVVPRLVPQLSSKMVLTAEFMEGEHMKMAQNLSQEVRDYIGTNIMRLCLQELFEFEFMQTDPNWANFLYSAQTKKIALLDFGASRAFDKSFLDKYLMTLKAAMEGDREACRHWSTELGFLTGYEADIMTQAHVDSVLEIGKPFAAGGLYDFGSQTVSDNVRSAIPVMLRHRLTPPPDETYSLHRKLSGAFLLCIRLRARVPCQDLFKNITSKYTFSDGSQLSYE